MKSPVPTSDPTLSDFSARPRILAIAALAVPIALAGVAAGLALLKLIRLATNIAYFGQFNFADLRLVSAHLGPWSVLIPIAGAFVVGLMARYGSEKIRGHGIPEAIEAILLGRSRLDLKVAILKPLSSAIAIGTGGPFGAEGPIIMTGGAIGSLVAQMLPVSDAERKTLLVGGAAAGMTTVFGTPIAAVMLGVELLLFEWRPRSFIPVVVAAITAAVARSALHMAEPLFPFAGVSEISLIGLASWIVLGAVAGLLACILSQLVYGWEDFFLKLPIHWMWWPMLGGLAVGLGGLIDPRALGVGYENIAAMLQGQTCVESPAAPACRESRDLVGRARFRDFRRRSRPAADDGWRGGRGSVVGHAGPVARILRVARHGGDDGRGDARAFDRDIFCGRIDRRSPCPAAAVGGLRDGLCGHRAFDAPLDPYREDHAPRPSPRLRIQY